MKLGAQATYSTINIGDDLPVVTTRVSLDLFRRYGGLGGDDASHHVSEEAAARTPYGKPIAQGVLTESFISVALTRWLADPTGWIAGGSLKCKLTAPVWADDLLTVRGTVIAKDVEGDPRYVTCQMTVENQDGKVVCAGEAKARV